MRFASQSKKSQCAARFIFIFPTHARAILFIFSHVRKRLKTFWGQKQDIDLSQAFMFYSRFVPSHKGTKKQDIDIDLSQGSIPNRIKMGKHNEKLIVSLTKRLEKLYKLSYVTEQNIKQKIKCTPCPPKENTFIKILSFVYWFMIMSSDL